MIFQKLGGCSPPPPQPHPPIRLCIFMWPLFSCGSHLHVNHEAIILCGSNMARLPVSVGSYLHEIVTFICPFSLYESHHLCSYPPHTAVLLWQSPSYGCQTHGSHLHMRSSLYGSHLHIVIFTWPPYHHMAVIHLAVTCL